MNTINVNDLQKIMKTNKDIKIVDVRTLSEKNNIYIDGTHHIPSEKISDHINDLKSEEPTYIVCASGNRSQQVCRKLTESGLKNIINVEGGMQSWIDQGLPVIKAAKQTMPIIRQVMTVAGILIMLGVACSIAFDSRFIFLSGGVGLGLFYAGVSGNCYMAKLLGYMPWNK